MEESEITAVYREEGRRVFATLVRLLGDFDLAEEALHEAFTAAVLQWPRDGVPQNPRAWLVSTGRFKAIDAIRRRARFSESLGELLKRVEEDQSSSEERLNVTVEDDRLRLIFTCCHPALAPATQVALTLREICGLTTEEIASAFLLTSATIAQRIVRGKGKIRDAGIPYRVPEAEELPERIESVLSVIYLVFNEGYSASSGDSVTRSELSLEAIRLGRLLLSLLPDPEVRGLLALMLLHESRRTSRVSEAGDIIVLEEQDRSCWNHDHIREGKELVQASLATGQIGQYTIQAAISAEHASAPTAGDTNWNQIVRLYDLLILAAPSPIVQLNRAVALAFRDGFEVGITAIREIFDRGELTEYHLAHAAEADLLRRLGRRLEARAAYEKALRFVQQEPERRLLLRRLREVE